VENVASWPMLTADCTENLQVRVRADVIHIPSEQRASIHRFVLRS